MVDGLRNDHRPIAAIDDEPGPERYYHKALVQKAANNPGGAKLSLRTAQTLKLSKSLLHPLEQAAYLQLMKELEENIDPLTKVEDLRLGQQQIVEIARALSVNSRILIMDEPTSSLTRHEADRLFPIIRDLKAQGVSVIYVSHRLKEVEEIADRVAVLRDGANAGELEGGQITHEAMVRLMAGRTTIMIAHRLNTLDGCHLRLQIERGEVVDRRTCTGSPRGDWWPGVSTACGRATLTGAGRAVAPYAIMSRRRAARSSSS